MLKNDSDLCLLSIIYNCLKKNKEAVFIFLSNVKYHWIFTEELAYSHEETGKQIKWSMVHFKYAIWMRLRPQSLNIP